MRTPRDVTGFIHSASAGGCRALLQGLTDGSTSLKAEGGDEREQGDLSHHSCSMSPEFSLACHMLWLASTLAEDWNHEDGSDCGD